MPMGVWWARTLVSSSLALALIALGVGAALASPSHPARTSEFGPFMSALPLAITTTNVTSSAIAGYAAVPSSGGGVTDVQASWNVPKTVGSCTGASAFSAFFVAIDGVASGASTMELIGMESNCTSSGNSYVGLYQFAPSGTHWIGLKIHAGDLMHGEVQYNTSSKKFTATLKDKTTGKSFFVTRSLATAKRASADWFVSTLSISGFMAPLANFGSVVFSNASATISGHTHSITGWNNYAVTMFSLNGSQVKASISPLVSSGSKFTVRWKAAGP